MGVIGSKKQPEDPNLLAQYHFSLFKPTTSNYVPIRVESGPSFNHLPSDLQQEITHTLQRIIRTADTKNAEQYNSYKCINCCMALLYIPTILVIPAAVLCGIFFYSYIIFRFGFTLFIIFCVILVFALCFVWCCACKYGRLLQQVTVEWRQNVIQKIYSQANQWQDQYTNITMTVIYPLIDRGGGKHKHVINIRGILRITLGGRPNQLPNVGPIYQGYGGNGAQQVVQQELVALNQPQNPQVMVQDVNGRQMMVQGKNAIVNGKQVIVVEQPQPQPRPQPMQLQPQLVPQYPIQQPQIAMSTHSHSNHAAPPSYVNQIPSAPPVTPPAYNPNANMPMQAPASQNEGRGDTLV